VEHSSRRYRKAKAGSVFYDAKSEGWLAWGVGSAQPCAGVLRRRRASAMEAFGDLIDWGIQPLAGPGWAVCGLPGATIIYFTVLDETSNLVSSSLSWPRNAFCH